MDATFEGESNFSLAKFSGTANFEGSSFWAQRHPINLRDSVPDVDGYPQLDRISFDHRY
jgi:hypothetical protein